MKRMTPEKSLLRAVLWLLQGYENNGLVRHFDRLNSGATAVGVGAGRRFIRMCRKGTPDVFAIRADGTVLWLELKSACGRQTEEQSEFERKIMGVPGHIYKVVREVDEVMGLFLINKACEHDFIYSNAFPSICWCRKCGVDKPTIDKEPDYISLGDKS